MMDGREEEEGDVRGFAAVENADGWESDWPLTAARTEPRSQSKTAEVLRGGASGLGLGFWRASTVESSRAVRLRSASGRGHGVNVSQTACQNVSCHYCNLKGRVLVAV